MSCASQPPDHFETTITVYGLIQPARFPRKTKHAVVFHRRCVPRKVRATCLDSDNALTKRRKCLTQFRQSMACQSTITRLYTATDLLCSIIRCEKSWP